MILMARGMRLALPPSPKLDRAPEELQLFPRLSKRSFSTELAKCRLWQTSIEPHLKKTGRLSRLSRRRSFQPS